MLSEIGQHICNRIFSNAYCRDDGTVAGWAILTGTAVIGINVIQYLRQQPDSNIAELKERRPTQNFNWKILSNLFSEAGHQFTDKNRLQWKDHFSRLDDIDQISPEDLEHSVMWGEDPSGRKFVSLKYVQWNPDKNGEKADSVFTIFQKYSGRDQLVEGGNHTPNWVTGVPEEISPVLKRFLKGAKVWAMGFDGEYVCCRLAGFQKRVRFA